MTDRERIQEKLDGYLDAQSWPIVNRSLMGDIVAEVERLIRDAAERAYVEAVLACAGTVDEIYKPVALPSDFPLVQP